MLYEHQCIHDIHFMSLHVLWAIDLAAAHQTNVELLPKPDNAVLKPPNLSGLNGVYN